MRTPSGPMQRAECCGDATAYPTTPEQVLAALAGAVSCGRTRVPGSEYSRSVGWVQQLWRPAIVWSPLRETVKRFVALPRWHEHQPGRLVRPGCRGMKVRKTGIRGRKTTTLCGFVVECWTGTASWLEYDPNFLDRGMESAQHLLPPRPTHALVAVADSKARSFRIHNRSAAGSMVARRVRVRARVDRFMSSKRERQCN